MISVEIGIRNIANLFVAQIFKCFSQIVRVLFSVRLVVIKFNKIAKFYEEYAKLWEAARTAKANYTAVAEAFLKKPNVDDIVKKAFCLTESIEGDTLNDEVKFENLKEGVIQFRGYTNHLSDDIFLQNAVRAAVPPVSQNSVLARVFLAPLAVDGG